MTEWIPVDERLPPRGQRVLVRGDSGVTTFPVYFVVAYHDDEYRPHNPWRDILNDAITDCFELPTHWRFITAEEMGQ
jgi:hypothetical protein